MAGRLASIGPVLPLLTPKRSSVTVGLWGFEIDASEARGKIKTRKFAYVVVSLKMMRTVGAGVHESPWTPQFDALSIEGSADFIAFVIDQ
jgi:hypothetical protein